MGQGAMDLFAGIGWFLSSSWRFFTQLTVPGLGISFAALFVGMFLIYFSIRIVFYILGLTSGGGSSVISVARKSSEKGSEKK